MEFFIVSKSKIKIVLTKTEAEARGVTNVAGLENDGDRRKGLRKILDEAKEKCGFDTGNEKVLVQIYPVGDSGIELFITKLGVLSKQAENLAVKKDCSAVLSNSVCYYIFPDFCAALGAARALGADFDGESSLWRFEGGEYCLTFPKEEIKSDVSGAFKLLEFGKKLNTGPLFSLFEHSRLLILRDAVRMLSRL